MAMASASDNPAHFNHVAFNERGTVFVVCGEEGTVIFRSDFRNTIKIWPAHAGSLAIAHMIRNTRFIGAVSGGSHPQHPKTTLQVWDSKKKQPCLHKTFTFKRDIVGIRSVTNFLFIITQKCIHVLTVPNLTIYGRVDTGVNVYGACHIMEPADQEPIIIYPGEMETGSVDIIILSSTKLEPTQAGSDQSDPDGIVELTTHCFQAHQHELVCLTATANTRRIATASVQGTLIRVWDHDTLEMIAEFRRGSDPTTIHSLSFSPIGDFLASSSAKGKVHVFAVSNTELNTKSMLHGYGYLGEYANSLWSCSNFILSPAGSSSCRFPSDMDGGLMAVTANGQIVRYKLNSENGSIEKIGMWQICYDNEKVIVDEDDPEGTRYVL